MRQLVQFRVILIERENCGSSTPHILHALEQFGWGRPLANDQQRLGPGSDAQPVDADSKVRGGAGFGRPADESRRELREAGIVALVGQVGGHVPRLVVGGTDNQQAAPRARAAPQRVGERRGPVKPTGRGKQGTQGGNLVGVHIPHGAGRANR